MASSKEYKDYVLDSLGILDNIIYRPMMGEYILYYNDVIFGGIYDDRLLIKKTSNNKKYNLEEEIPYNNAKPMYLVSDLDNRELLKNIIIDTYDDLK